jgi:hypothetical protein
VVIEITLQVGAIGVNGRFIAAAGINSVPDREESR